MKKNILLLMTFGLLSMSAMTVHAQGYTLQFGGVVLVNNTPQTVPAGKVWKIESVMHSNDLNAAGYGLSWQAVSSSIIVNGSTVYINRNTSGSARIYYSSYVDPNAVSDMNLTSLPIWLPAGTQLAAGTNVNLISVVEFILIAP